MTRREILLAACEHLGITDGEAGELQWQSYLTEEHLAEAILCLRGVDAYREALCAVETD